MESLRRLFPFDPLVCSWMGVKLGEESPKTFDYHSTTLELKNFAIDNTSVYLIVFVQTAV